MIQLKNVEGEVLYEADVPDVKSAVEEASRKKISLARVYLRGDDLQSANLRYADLRYANLQYAIMQSANLRYADLRYANLQYAIMQSADLQSADLRYASMRGAIMQGANLQHAIMQSADLQSADLRYASMRYASMRGAIMQGANLQHAIMQSADLQSADLRYASMRGAIMQGADLQDAKLPTFAICPEQGAFIGFKKLRDSRIATLEIPAAAARTSSLVGRKCRAAYVTTLAITSIDGLEHFERGFSMQAAGRHRPGVDYEVGKESRPDSYDDDIRVECARGIHFFITRQEAVDFSV